MKTKYFIMCCILLIGCILTFGVEIETDDKNTQNDNENIRKYVIQSELDLEETVAAYTTPPDKELIPEYLYYKIPVRFEKADFSKDIQEYLYDECADREIEYSIALALIERESGYNSKCSGDNGNSKGYMQVYQKWHEEEMEAENVKDLYDPKGNIRVGLHILQELYKKYGSSGDHCVLMVYNMGSSTANKLWKQGIYSTEYTREILSRAKEIKKDLTQD